MSSGSPPAGPCGRPTKAGTPCRLGRGSASVYAGFRMVWESPACNSHLTSEEREAQQAVEVRLRAALAKIEPACWSWPLPPTSKEDLLGRLFAPDDPFFAELVRCFDINDLVFGAFEKYRARNPASILGVRLPYTGFGWEDGVPIGGWATQAHRRRDHDLWTDNPAARLGL